MDVMSKGDLKQILSI